MIFEDINIRDPFVLVEGGLYYLYGSRAADGWGKCTGLDVYVSDDLAEWSGPRECFTPPGDFWSDINFWAPEVHKYRGRYYMFVSFKSETRERGTQILAADSPLGPFGLHSDGPVTPEAWSCLDGTLYLERDGTPYMVFCHEWTQVGDGEICAMRLSDDLSAPAGEPWLLFKASSTGWAQTGDPPNVTDGPFLHRLSDGTLLMLWSSLRGKSYVEAVAYSDNGRLDGVWRHKDELLFDGDGGHGMLFTDLDGGLRFIMHCPNKTPDERPVVKRVAERGGTLIAE